MTRNSIVVEPLQTGEDGKPVLPTNPQQGAAPGIDTLAIPKDFEGVDERYRGKSVTEIIDMHKNAERKIGEQGAEVHTWRNLVSELTQNGAGQPAAEPEPETPIELTSDDLLANPAQAIGQVVAAELQKALKPVTERQDRNDVLSAQEALLRDYPQMTALGQDEAFLTWAQASQSRAADANATQAGDPVAARRLLEQWTEREALIKELQGGKAETTPQPAQPQTELKPQGPDGAAAAVTEVGGSGAAPTAPTLTAEEILNTIMHKPDLYRSNAYQQRVMEAAKAGTIDLQQIAQAMAR